MAPEPGPDSPLVDGEGPALEGTVLEPARGGPSPTPAPSPDDGASERVSQTTSVDRAPSGSSTALPIALATGVLVLLLLIAREWAR